MDLPEARSLAILEINRHIPEYSFEFNMSTRALGTCSFRKKTIYLSEHWTKACPKSEVLDTILHEIAHAIAYRDYGDPTHGKHWKLVARMIGATPEAKAKIDIKLRDHVKPKYQMVLETTGEVIRDYYQRPSQRMIDRTPHLWLRGREDETRGKLRIVSCTLSKHSVLKSLYEKGITRPNLAKKCKHCNKKDTNWEITHEYKWRHGCGAETSDM